MDIRRGKARAKVSAYTGAFPFLHWKLLLCSVCAYSVLYEQLVQYLLSLGTRAFYSHTKPGPRALSVYNLPGFLNWKKLLAVMVNYLPTASIITVTSNRTLSMNRRIPGLKSRCAGPVHSLVLGRTWISGLALDLAFAFALELVLALVLDGHSRVLSLSSSSWLTSTSSWRPALDCLVSFGCGILVCMFLGPSAASASASSRRSAALVWLCLTWYKGGDGDVVRIQTVVGMSLFCSLPFKPGEDLVVGDGDMRVDIGRLGYGLNALGIDAVMLGVVSKEDIEPIGGMIIPDSETGDDTRMLGVRWRRATDTVRFHTAANSTPSQA